MYVSQDIGFKLHIWHSNTHCSRHIDTILNFILSYFSKVGVLKTQLLKLVGTAITFQFKNEKLAKI